MAKSAKQIVKDLAQDVENAASEVVNAVGALYPLADDGLPATVRDAYATYHAAVARLARATGVGA